MCISEEILFCYESKDKVRILLMNIVHFVCVCFVFSGTSGARPNHADQDTEKFLLSVVYV